jgi:hypothetical protein
MFDVDVNPNPRINPQSLADFKPKAPGGATSRYNREFCYLQGEGADAFDIGPPAQYDQCTYDYNLCICRRPEQHRWSATVLL